MLDQLRHPTAADHNLKGKQNGTADELWSNGGVRQVDARWDRLQPRVTEEQAERSRAPRPFSPLPYRSICLSRDGQR
ncbi:unnamed protein product [Arctogadus glacialis]